ncbi:MAG TPA: hypothetical protein DEB06_04040 [Phycisphaerales bacterium]|nr:hypothetical protein [Phycisphaerales bacterium]
MLHSSGRVLCALFLLPAGADALAQGPPPADKSGYHLFDPTPRELRREMSADRPDATESPYTVDAGGVQLEMSFAEYSYDRDDGRDAHSWSLAPVNLKLGLTNNADLQFLLSPWDAESGEVVEESSGFAGAGLRLKVNLHGNDSGGFALGLLPFILFPSGNDEAGPQEVEGGFAIPMAVELPHGWGLGWQVQVEWLRDEADEGYDTLFSHTVVFGHDIVGELAGYIEFIGEVFIDGPGGYRPSLSAGLTSALSPDAQLDLGVVIGLDDDQTDDLRVFSGLTLRF